MDRKCVGSEWRKDRLPQKSFHAIAAMRRSSGEVNAAIFGHMVRSECCRTRETFLWAWTLVGRSRFG